MANIDKAVRLGYDVFETDVSRTKDGHLVLMHDPSVTPLKHFLLAPVKFCGRAGRDEIRIGSSRGAASLFEVSLPERISHRGRHAPPSPRLTIRRGWCKGPDNSNDRQPNGGKGAVCRDMAANRTARPPHSDRQPTNKRMKYPG